MIDANLEKPVHVKMDDALQLTMFAAGLISLLRIEHPALDGDHETMLAKLALEDLLGNIPPLLEHMVIEDDQDIPEVKCPVTGQVVQADGDESLGRLDFEESDAYVCLFDDVELDCAAFAKDEIETAWQAFISEPPPYEGYKELILYFVVYNYHSFQFMDLLLVKTPHPHLGGMTTYTLLDRNYKGEK